MQYRDADGSRNLRLEQAQCYFEVIPGESEDSAIKLRFRPVIRNGKATMKPKVAHDPGGSLRWALDTAEPTEEFPSLAWNLWVRPDEFVVLGARTDRPGTLGTACFARAEGQAVLVLRARPLTARDVPLPQTPPLAAQACLYPLPRSK